MRDRAPEVDPLRLGVGWNVEDLGKPWVLVDSVEGQSHPGSVHLGGVAGQVEDGVLEMGGRPGRYSCTDICDGIAQGTVGMSYSLPSREVIADAVEMHALAGHFDAMALVSGCDKSVPGHLMTIARVDQPAVHVPGGSMTEGPGCFTLERVGTIYSELQRGEISPGDYELLRERACPSAGSCSLMGTAITMQIVSEALGLALPGSAVTPVGFNLTRRAHDAGRQVMRLVEDDGPRPGEILTREAFENAIMVHAAVGGSTNALLHLPVIAREAGVKIGPGLFDEVNREIPFLANVRPSGEYPAVFLWYAGAPPMLCGR